VLSYHRFDPSACGFPRPRVPLLPPPSLAQLTLRRAAPARAVRRYARGRYALRAAYALAGVGPQGALLAPAYHCRTMLDPALRLGAEVVLYPLTETLQPDLPGLRRVIAACRTRPQALLLTHYFGLPADIAPIATLCRELGLVLIEDGSHALLRGDADETLGRSGRYAVSSPYKFFPCPDGGLLWANEGAPLPLQPPPSPGAKAELRGLWHALQALGQHAAPPDPSALADELTALQSGAMGRDWVEAGNGLSDDYRPAEEFASSLAVSRWLLAHADRESLARRRRRRYAQWVEAVSGLPGCRALFPVLPAGCVPYMFPLLVEDPARCFHPLKRVGLPIWRWDDMAISSCAVAQRYRQSVFHLPCHQALDDTQMDWMTAALTQALVRR
jgi:perosamine synthetase